MKPHNTKQQCNVTPRSLFKEFFSIFFHQDDLGLWYALLDKPLLISLSPDDQIEHLMKHSYLAGCNKSFAEMYGYGDPNEMIGIRFPQLLVRSESSNLHNMKMLLANQFQGRNIETIEFCKNGDRRYFLNDYSGVIEGKYLLRIWGRQQDITSIKAQKESNRLTLNKFTPQQLKILELTLTGKTLKEISSELGINPKTVDTLRSRIKQKLGASTFYDLAIRSIQLNLFDLST